MPSRPENYIPVVMFRENTKSIPDFRLPPGYRLRRYHDGDRQTWVAIQQLSEPYQKVTGATFDEQFGRALWSMRKRCIFLVAPDGTDVGTVTAWSAPKYHKAPAGRIHWLAIVPEHRGKGLSKVLTAAALGLLRGYRHRRAMLVTHVPRTAAIKAYLDCGFVPDMDAPHAERAWELVRQSIQHPGLGNAP